MHTFHRFLAHAALACVAVGFTHQALGHARWDPQGLIKPRSNRDDIKSGPCGDPRGSNPVTLAAGATVTLSIERTIYHQGYFRIAFSPADDQGFDSYVLADHVMENSSQRLYDISVTLPDMECENCTLQMIQVMLDRNPPSNYYSCADIRLVRGTAEDSQPPAGVSQVLAIGSGDSVQLNWTNPSDEDLAGILITEGAAALSAQPVKGLEYEPGTALGNATVVFSGAATEAVLSGRNLGTTYHYNLFAYDQNRNYSPAVSAQVTLEDALPNLAPSVQLAAEQNGQMTQRIKTSGGLVTVQAQISDANTTDHHQVVWATEPALVDLDQVEEQFTFDPSTLPQGSVHIAATVSDDGKPPLSTTAEFSVVVERQAESKSGALSLWWWILLSALPMLRMRRRKV